jgi:peptide chain release factor subunit 1
MLSPLDVEALNSFRSEYFLATSLYLPLDVEQPPKYPILLRGLSRAAAAELERGELAHEVLEAAHRDLERIERYVRDLDRARALGLAVFCSSGEDYWRAEKLPAPLPARLLQRATFYVRPLAGLLDEYRPVMLVLIGRRRARIFQIAMGEVQERSDILGDVPSRVREAGWAGYAERSIRGHIEDHLRRHFEEVAARMFGSFKENRFDWLVVGGPEPSLPEFIATLHPYLRERLRGTLTIRADAPEAEVVAAGLEVEQRLKAERDAELVAKVKEGLFPGGWAVSGAADTIQLVAQGQVRTLLVRPGYSRPGVRCPRCNLLLPDKRACPLGCAEAVAVRDVIDEAVGLAFEAGAEVAHVEHEAMEELGNVAALLRYPSKKVT